METPVSADGVRQILATLDSGDLVLSDSGGQHVEGVVQERTQVLHNGPLLKLRSRGSADIRLAVPAGVDLKVRTRGGDILATAPLGSAQATTSSGDIRLESVTGAARLTTGSGDINVASTGNVQARSGSGDVTVGSASGQIQVRTGSGDITVGANYGYAWLESGSGDISLGIPESVATLLDVKSWTGSVSVSAPQRERPENGEQARIHAVTSSGDIRIFRA